MTQVDRNGTVKTALPGVAASGRRNFLAVAAGGAIAGFPMIAMAREATVLRLQGAWSAKDIFHEYALDFAKKINDMSGGRLRVDVLPAGALVKPQDLQEAVHRGVIDGCHAVPAFWHGRNTAFSLFGSGPALGLDANGLLAWIRHGGGMALYLELIHRQMNLDIVPFFYGPMPTQPLGWFKKPVKSGTEFRGLKLRAEGLVADLFREMGAKPEAVPMQDIVAAMQRGRIDAAEFNNASSDRWLGLPDAARICMLQSYHQPAEVFEVLFNRKKFEALPTDLRAIVRHAAEAASADMSWKAAYRYADDQAWLRERGVQFHKTPALVLRAQLRAWSAVAARHAQQNPLFDKVWRSQLEWARRTVGWSRETIVNPAAAHDYWFAGKSGKTGKSAKQPAY